MNSLSKICVSLTLFIFCSAVSAKVYVQVQTTLAPGSVIGTISFENTPYGLLITPDLTDLPPGAHGVHLHEKPACSHQGKDAGGHFDPKKTGKHLGPYRSGHLGDLPVLYVDSQGLANIAMLAPRLKEKHVNNLSLMIHAGGDNYSDEPKPLGGGGPRIACGVIGLAK